MHIQGSRADLRVPVREVALTNGERMCLYDVSGPYDEPDAVIDVRRGLPAMRAGWIAERADTEPYEGRIAQLQDDGGKGERDNPRIAALREQARGLIRQPRRAKVGGNVTQSCVTGFGAASDLPVHDFQMGVVWRARYE